MTDTDRMPAVGSEAIEAARKFIQTIGGGLGAGSSGGPAAQFLFTASEAAEASLGPELFWVGLGITVITAGC